METEERVVVLVVEDDAMVGDFLTRTLSRDGYQVVTAPTGEEALRIASERHLDVALIDGFLPDVHGVDLAKLLLSGDGVDLPMCLISGALPADIDARSGFAALAKPVRPSTITDTVARLLTWRAANATPEQRDAALDELVATFSVQP